MKYGVREMLKYGEGGGGARDGGDGCACADGDVHTRDVDPRSSREEPSAVLCGGVHELRESLLGKSRGLDRRDMDVETQLVFKENLKKPRNHVC